jgi:hypothetical protein
VPWVNTRVRNTPGVVLGTWRANPTDTSSGRPTPMLSAISASKKARTRRGTSNTMVRDTSTWRIDSSHQYPAARSAALNGSG